MTRMERRIMEILEGCQGQERAITVAELQRLLRMSTRRIRAALARLAMERHRPIAATIHPPHGFYLVTTGTEARECLRQRWSRDRNAGRRAGGLNAAGAARLSFETQQELTFP